MYGATIKKIGIFLYSLFLGESRRLNILVPTFRNTLLFLRRSSCLNGLWRWNRKSVPKRRKKIQTLVNHPQEGIQLSQHGESLKSRWYLVASLHFCHWYRKCFSFI